MKCSIKSPNLQYLNDRYASIRERHDQMKKLFYKKYILVLTSIFALNVPTTAIDGAPDPSEISPFIAGCKAVPGAAKIAEVVNDLHERIRCIKDENKKQAIKNSFNYCTKNGYVVYYTAPHRSSIAIPSHPYFFAYPYHVEVHKVWFGDPKKYPGDDFPVDENLREHLQQLLNEVKPDGVFGVPPDALNVSVIAEKRGTAKLKNPDLKVGGGNQLYFQYSLIARFPFTNEEEVLVDNLFVKGIMQNKEIFTRRRSEKSRLILSNSFADKKDNYLIPGIGIGATAGEAIFSYFLGESKALVGVIVGGIIGGIAGYNIES